MLAARPVSMGVMKLAELSPLPGRAANAANLRDRSVLDRDIGLVAREPGAVDDHPVPDQQVIGHTILRSSCLASARMITLRARGVQHGVSPGTLQSAPARVPRRPLSLLSPPPLRRSRLPGPDGPVGPHPV